MPEIKTQVFKLDPYEPQLNKIKIAAKILRDGGLVAFPTETVYGLGANLNDEAAIARLYEVKKRPKEKKLSIHIVDARVVKEYASEIPQAAYKLMHRFWPGPVTIVLKAKNTDTVGFRFPRNQIAYGLIKEANVPVVAPSANISDAAPPKSASEVLMQLNGQIDVVLDGGNTALGVESTVVDLSGPGYKILRQGSVSEGAVKKAIDTKFILVVCTGNTCRSVMASDMLQKELASRKDIEILSAGVSAIPGAGASFTVAEVMKEQGYDVSDHVSRSVTDELINMSDIILVMEKAHRDRILEKAPQVKNKVHLLREYLRDAPIPENDPESGEVPDPVGRDKAFNRYVYGIIKENIDRIAGKL
ncbi:MAG: L-threonylcarbamoyladenylate synthase [Candidatus Omnitrophota bacterium]